MWGEMNMNNKACYECIHNGLCPFKRNIHDYENKIQRFIVDDGFYVHLAEYCLHYLKRAD